METGVTLFVLEKFQRGVSGHLPYYIIEKKNKKISRQAGPVSVRIAVFFYYLIRVTGLEKVLISP